MKKKHLLRVTALLFMAALLAVTLLFSHADFGDIGGNSDFGGYDGGNDYDYNDYGGYDDDDNGIYIFSNNDDDGDGSSSGLLAAIVIVVIIVILYTRKNSKGTQARPAGAERTSASSLRPMSEYKELDPAFSEEGLRETVSNLYVKMQNAWTARDLSPLEPYFTDALYKQSCRQVDAMKEAHRINYVERISVLGTELQGFRQNEGMDEIVVLLRTRIVDYSVDENTGDVVSGDKNKEKFMTYEWHMMRKTGAVTKTEEELTHVVCPSCGAAVDINATAKCEYCGTVLHIANENWAIGEIRGISQQTV